MSQNLISLALRPDVLELQAICEKIASNYLKMTLNTTRSKVPN